MPQKAPQTSTVTQVCLEHDAELAEVSPARSRAILKLVETNLTLDVAVMRWYHRGEARLGSSLTIKLLSQLISSKS